MKKGAKEMRKFDFYNDPGHAWLKVTRKELVELGIEQQISGYSYQKGDAVYLEEDSDAPKFANAWEKKHGVKFEDSIPSNNVHISDRASRIRTYQPFRPNHDPELNAKMRAVQDKIEHAIRNSKGSLEDESRIDDLACELLKLEELSL
ncbi:hypothetical protein ES703_14186 [subsurface metagenome]